MDEQEKKIRIKLRDDYQHYASKCLTIRTKDGVSKLILNRAQTYTHEIIENQRRSIGKVRVLILKGRQQGISTYVAGRFYHQVTHRIGCRAFILTHATDATNNLFDMTQRYHQNCPKIVRPDVDVSNAKELYFAGLDSGFKVGTAGNKTVGRSQTIQLLHGSEVAFWENATEHAKGILQTVPFSKGTEVIFESTANGTGNYFHEQWQLAETGESDFIPIFVPWFWQQEYRRDVLEDFQLREDEYDLIKIFDLAPAQLLWRRAKILELSAGGADGNKAFLQEYPNTAIDAFQLSGENGFLSPEIVLRARKSTIPDPYGALVVGVDPARFGNDRTSIIRRKGRVAYNLRSYVKKDTMEIVGICNSIINNEKPDRMFIDVGGLGAGIVDRLNELGYSDIVVGVNFGGTPLDQEKYNNKRAEMWGLCKEWLGTPPTQIPDVDSLHADLCGIKYKIDSQSRLVMESSEDMKKRGMRSPDEATALILTFAMPVEFANSKKKKANEKAARVMGKSTHEARIRDLYGLR